ncbi:MAG TPA: DNA alkylation repair protein [Bryobacteraceae bacterium]|nr:DNA alkylation repair protein [Bryobacteraceae bacterium]
MLEAVLGDLRRQLRLAATEERRRRLRQFFRQPVTALGVPAVEQKRAAATLYRPVKSWPVSRRNRLCRRLWEGGILEEGNVAIYLCRRFATQAGREQFRLFEEWVDRYVRNWAHCDGVGVWLLGAAIRNEPRLGEELLPWTESPNPWKRRAAAVALVGEAKQGRQRNAILAIADKLLDDPDDMVQKGVGWLLKETYPRQAAAVVNFLRKRRHRAARIVLRYAAEKMTRRHREQVLAR